MVAVAGYATGLGFAFDDEDFAANLAGQRGCSGQSRRSAPDDRDGYMLVGHRAPPPESSSARVFAPQ